MTPKQKLDKLYKLKYLESVEIEDYYVTRVPSGWLFKSTTIHFVHGNAVGGSESTVFIEWVDRSDLPPHLTKE